MTTSGQVRDHYQRAVIDLLETVSSGLDDSLRAAAEVVAERVIADELVYVYGPGGHSNLASQEVFFRAGGLVNMSAILDGGTLLSNGALRSMAIERTPGYGRIVIEDNSLGADDVLILVNSYGINAALIDAALEARRRGCVLIGVSSRVHAEATPADHPARHPSKSNLHDLVDHHLDTRIEVGDAALRIDGVDQPVAALSTFANAFVMNCLSATAIAIVAERGVAPTIWRSGNAPDGDDLNGRFQDRFRRRVRWL